MTLHGLGLMTIKMKIGGNIKINKGKNYLLTKKLREMIPSYFKSITWKKQVELSAYLNNLNDAARMFVTEDLSEVKKHLKVMGKPICTVREKHVIAKTPEESLLMDEGTLEFVEETSSQTFLQQRGKYKITEEILWKLYLEIRNSVTNEVDFLDMIYIPVVMNLDIPFKPHYLTIDEAQDLNYCQHRLIDMIIKQPQLKKWVAVGDSHQCQPKGTKVLMKDLSEKNIEDLKIGDQVITYDIDKCQFVGNGKAWNAKAMKVLDKKTDYRLEPVFTFTLKTRHKSSYTSNHKCYVQFSEDKMKDKYVVYMMRRRDNYRLGISPCWTRHKTNAFAPVMRARAEKADDLWILKTFDTRQEALLQEQILSYKFKIPQVRFIDNSNSSKGFSQNELDTFWSKFKNEHSARNILGEFNKELYYPLWSNTNRSQGGKGNSWKLSSKAMFKTQACNILPDIMQMCIWDLNNVDSRKRIKKTLVDITDCEINFEAQEFVSLDIERDHNYVADGILTGNSIYGFAGSLSNSFDMFKEKDNVVEKNLSTCYRCDTEIVSKANQVYNIMKPFKHTPGIVEYYDNPDKIEFEPQAMVICRNVAPLLFFFFYLASRGIPCILKGEDLITKIINHLKPFKSIIFNKHISDMYIELIKLKDKTDEESRIKYFILKEKVDIMKILRENLDVGHKYIQEVIPILQALFEEKEMALTLCSIHKAKGMESNTVYWLYPELIPSQFAVSADQLKQEENLKYVAITRAIEKLVIINLKEKHNATYPG
jgi:hypothetical protein